MLLPECTGPDFDAGAFEEGERVELLRHKDAIDLPFFVRAVKVHAVSAACDDMLPCHTGVKHQAVCNIDDEAALARGESGFCVFYCTGVEDRYGGKDVFGSGVVAAEGGFVPVCRFDGDAGAEGFLFFCHDFMLFCVWP